MNRIALLAAAVGCVVLAAPVAAQNTYNFAYSGSGVDASGSFTTGTTTDANGYYTVTSISGSRNGVMITGLAPSGTVVDTGGDKNDNLFKPSAPYVTFPGIGYYLQGSSLVFNPYYGGSYREDVGSSTVDGGDIALSSFVVAAATPEPATWSLMILGFGMTGYALRRRARPVVLAA